MALKLKEKVDVRGPKAVQRSFVKDPKEKLALHRLRVLELSKELGSVAEACRRSGMDRTSFFEWRRRYQTHGLEGLKDLPPVHRSHPAQKPAHVREAVLALSRENPAWGSKRLSAELAREGLSVSNFTVQRMLRRAGLADRFSRYLSLEGRALAGDDLPEDVLRRLERSNPCFRERRVESSRPGELVCLDTFYVGLFKGVGRVYMASAVDTFGSYAFACLATDRTARRAAELLWGQVVPFYEAHGLALSAVLTDNGTEFCGNEEHPFEALAFGLKAEHRRTRVKRPQTNGFAERFHRTVLEEFFRVEFRTRAFETLDALEGALQEWIVQYNTQRPHQGYRNMGATPYQTVEKHLENESQDA